MSRQTPIGTTVLVFGHRRVPRPLSGLPITRMDAAGNDNAAINAGIDAAINAAVNTAPGKARLIVVGSDADLAAVLSRMLRKDLLDIEVAPVPGRSWLSARRARLAPARRVPLIRDDTATVLVGHALWLPPSNSTNLCGEAVVDDTVLFDGDVAGVRIEPTLSLPGLRARVLDGRRSWVTGRAAQLGTTGAQVVRDDVPGQREIKRSTFYRHTTGWLRVG